MSDRAAMGIRMHSGWGALVVVSALGGTARGGAEIEIVDRRRVTVMNEKMAGAKQPFHYAEPMELPDAERHLARCKEATTRLALEALREIVGELEHLKYRVACGAILEASGRALPALPDILKSHAMIHTAEGEFFRQAARDACGKLKIPVTGIRERDLDTRAKEIFGKRATALMDKISAAGKKLGPPWTMDQKTAALAAAIVLAARAR